MRRESHKQYRGLWRNSRFWGSGIRGKITQARGSQGIHAGWRRRTARDVFVRLTQVQRSSPPAGWNSSGARCADSLMKTRTEGRFHLSLPLFPAVFSLPPPRRQPAVLSAGPLLELLGPASWSRPAPALRCAPAGCGPESWGGAFAALAALALLLGLPDGVGADWWKGLTLNVSDACGRCAPLKEATLKTLLQGLLMIFRFVHWEFVIQDILPPRVRSVSAPNRRPVTRACQTHFANFTITSTNWE